jgi:hypothetical protein
MEIKDYHATDHLLTNYDDAKAKAIELADTGATYADMARTLRIGISTLIKLRRKDADFRDQLEHAMQAASHIVLDDIKKIPWEESSAQMAKVKIDALRTYLELRWPQLYGKRIDVTVRTLDMRQALDLARERVKRQGQVIDLHQSDYHVQTDCISVLGASTLESLLD